MNARTVLFALCVATSLASAQGGSGSGGCFVGNGFECIKVYSHQGDGRTERYSLRAIVLWRGEATERVGLRDTARARVRERLYTAARRAAEDSGRALIGSAGTMSLSTASMTWGFPLRVRDSLFVMDLQIELPQRDSAVVVMIEMLPGDSTPPARLVGITWVPAELDDRYWPKNWRSGDTTFTIQPRVGNTILRDSLLKSPIVRSFLLQTP